MGIVGSGLKIASTPDVAIEDHFSNFEMHENDLHTRFISNACTSNPNSPAIYIHLLYIVGSKPEPLDYRGNYMKRHPSSSFVDNE